uniref:ZP domain-containing protein n=1 Tax=Onchocerca volvulus TaxID=6282 RepID=A0A8R1TX07_ONCVO
MKTFRPTTPPVVRFTEFNSFITYSIYPEGSSVEFSCYAAIPKLDDRFACQNRFFGKTVCSATSNLGN